MTVPTIPRPHDDHPLRRRALDKRPRNIRRWVAGLGLAGIALFGAPGVAEAATTGCYETLQHNFGVTSTGDWRHFRGSEISIDISANEQYNGNDMYVTVQFRDQDRGIHHFPRVHETNTVLCPMDTGCIISGDIGKSDQMVRFLYGSKNLRTQVGYAGDVTMCSTG